MPSRRAILIGCNYPGTNAALRGCVNDVWGMKAILEEFYGFDSSDITIMIDTDRQYLQPTGKNIKGKIIEMVAAAQDGDICVLHFSGHGTQIPSPDGEEKDGKDEAICPTDLNVICDDDLRALLKPLEAKPGVKFTFVADCCHSGTLLDHGSVQISGPKAGAPPPPQADTGVLAGLLAALGQPDGRDFKNRALPFSDLCGLLGDLLGGQRVDARNVRSQLGQLFGPDSSAKVQQVVQALQMLTAGVKAFTGDGDNGNGGGGLGGLMQLLCSCLAPPSTVEDGPTGQPANASSGPGAQYAVSGGNPGEPELLVTLPAPGSKPPPDQQLAADVGILITGCQSHETSADACPSGNPSKAHGALSNAIQTVVRQHHQQMPDQPLTFRNLVIGVRELLAKTGFSQNPCLECSDSNADTSFIVH